MSNTPDSRSQVERWFDERFAKDGFDYDYDEVDLIRLINILKSERDAMRHNWHVSEKAYQQAVKGKTK
jgi:hypothetical protein